MKHVVEYKLHGGQVPYFISKGGYFPNGGKLIGVTKDDEHCHIPSDLVKHKDSLSLSVHLCSLSLTDKSGQPLTDDQKTKLATDWWAKHV